MQYSTWGLTREEQRGTNTSFARLATSLLMQPRMELTFSVHTDGSCKSFHALEPPEPSPQEKFSMTSSPSLHWSIFVSAIPDQSVQNMKVRDGGLICISEA